MTDNMTKKQIYFCLEKRDTSFFKDYIDCIYAQKSIESYVHIFRGRIDREDSFFNVEGWSCLKHSSH